MRKFLFATAVAMLLVISLAASSGAVTKVAKTLNVMDLYFGSGMPMGTYNGLPGDAFYIDDVLIDIDAEDMYGSPLAFAFGYGRVIDRHYLFSLQFRYANHDLAEVIPTPYEFNLLTNPGTKVRQYDLALNMNYQLLDLSENTLTPYAGLGARAGFTSKTLEGYLSENQLNFSAALNFGAEFKLMTSASKRSFVTLASVNSWEFFATGDRPYCLNIGGALKYYFRP